MCFILVSNAGHTSQLVARVQDHNFEYIFMFISNRTDQCALKQSKFGWVLVLLRIFRFVWRKTKKLVLHCFMLCDVCFHLRNFYSLVFSARSNIYDLIDAPICLQSILKFYDSIGGAHQPTANPTKPTTLCVRVCNVKFILFAFITRKIAWDGIFRGWSAWVDP